MMKFPAICQLLVLFVLLPQWIRAKLCSDVLSQDVIKEVTYKEPCTQKYTARCGWLSLNYCTFYHQTYCDKKKNDTVTTYYVVTRCCEGYYKAANGSCLIKGTGVEISKTTKVPDYVVISNGVNHTHKATVDETKVVTEESPLEKISGGGYAGIICGFVFACAVTFFIIRAIRKRQIRNSNKHKPSKVEYSVQPLSSLPPPSPQLMQPEMEPLATTAVVSEENETEIKEVPESVV